MLESESVPPTASTTNTDTMIAKADPTRAQHTRITCARQTSRHPSSPHTFPLPTPTPNPTPSHTPALRRRLDLANKILADGIHNKPILLNIFYTLNTFYFPVDFLTPFPRVVLTLPLHSKLQNTSPTPDNVLYVIKTSWRRDSGHTS
jgi:hypothetical protein